MIIQQFKKYIKTYLPNGTERLENNNIVIVTYKKLSLLLKKAKNLKIDCAICDELHRSGAETYEPAIDAIMEDNDIEVIGMTATPERTDKRNMAYEKFGDNVVYEMSLTEALSGEKEGEVVLEAPRYIRALSVLRDTIEEYREKDVGRIEK